MSAQHGQLFRDAIKDALIGKHVEVLSQPRGDRFGIIVGVEKTLIGERIRVRFSNGMPDGLFSIRNLRAV